jgi:hypothetical protein
MTGFGKLQWIIKNKAQKPSDVDISHWKHCQFVGA